MSNETDRIHIAPAGDRIEIWHGDLPPVHQFRGTDYWLDSTASVVQFVMTKGSIEHTVISYNDAAIKVILDDTVVDRPQDVATYGFTPSQDLVDWKAVFDRPLYQKEFVDFLKRRLPGEVRYVESLIASVQKLKVNTQIVGDYQFDDNNNFTFMFKSQDGEGSVRLPSVVTVWITLLNESDHKASLDVELELRKPTSEKERPTFVLTCPKLPRYMKDAVQHEVKKLKEALPGYLILAGKI